MYMYMTCTKLFRIELDTHKYYNHEMLIKKKTTTTRSYICRTREKACHRQITVTSSPQRLLSPDPPPFFTSSSWPSGTSGSYFSFTWSSSLSSPQQPIVTSTTSRRFDYPNSTQLRQQSNYCNRRTPCSTEYGMSTAIISTWTSSMQTPML